VSAYRSFLVPYDFSDHARAALYTALDLARHLEAHCHLLHVVQPFTVPYGGLLGGQAVLPPPNMLEIHEGIRKSLDEVISGIADPPGGLEPHVADGANVAVTVCQMADELESDLIVMGTHGRTGIAHAFLGSVAERTLRNAPCPVLTVRCPEPEISK